MPATVIDITASLDGFVAGPDASVEHPLGRGGERLHEWAYDSAAWRARHGETGGETGVDDEAIREQITGMGAVVMGRRMFSGGSGPWEDDPMADGWWGDEPPFGVPVFVVTHHRRAPLEKGGTTFVFVTDGVEAAHAQARTAAGERNISVGGGADVVQQLLAAGLVDKLRLHVAPILLGDGVRLFERLDPGRLRFEPQRVVHSPRATHVHYLVHR